MNTPLQAKILAVEIGGTKLHVGLGNAQGTLESLHRFAIQREEGAGGILARIESTLAQSLGRGAIDAVGVGFGGPVDWQTGIVSRSHHVEGWAGMNLRAWFEERLTCPICVDNDANIAALGEAICGAGAGLDPVFYVTLGSGVGGGLVVHGSLYHGATPGESEIGHLLLDRQGTTVEERCSGWAVDARIKVLAESGSMGPLAALARSDPGQESRHLGSALAQGDLAAARLLEEWSADLAWGLSHVAHLFHPAVIVLGGGLSLVGEPLRTRVASALKPLVMEAFRPEPRVVLSRLGQEVVPIGALVAAGRFIADGPEI